MPWCQRKMSTVRAAVAAALAVLAALAFISAYVVYSRAHVARLPTSPAHDRGNQPNISDAVGEATLGTSSGSPLQRIMELASAKLSRGVSRDAVAHETISTFLSHPNGSTFLAQAHVQRTLSEILHMDFADASRVHIIMQSYRQSYHTKDYVRIASPPACPNGTLGVIVVPSLPIAVVRRELIRKAWSNRLTQWPIRLVFVLGRTPDVAEKDIAGEHELHKDLLVVDFVESYFNLSLKCLLAMQWVSEHCASASYMVKADDDVYIYPENLHKLLLSREPHERKIVGNAGIGFKPHRSISSKWYVPVEIYRDEGYPAFVFGPCYMLAVDTLRDLVDSCKRLPYVYLEDVFITGICSHATKVPIQHEQVAYFLVNDCKNSRAVAVHHSKMPYRIC